MSDRHVDAHWNCKNCGTQLIRSWKKDGAFINGGYWVYIDGGNGERTCRDVDRRQEPPGIDAPHHEPEVIDLADPAAVEEWLVR